MEDETQTPPRRQYQNYRSTASVNWRNKDDSPRVESPQQQRGGFPRGGGDRDGQRGGYGQDRGYQQRDRNTEIPAEVTTPRLYVGNLLYTAQSADIESFFVDNGFAVANLSMSIDPMTGRNPSYCFVDLESVEDAKRAMDELNGKEVMGRSVRINPGVSKKEGAAGPRVNGRSGWGSGTPPANGDASPKPSYDRWNRSDAAPAFNKPQESGKRLYIGGLPQMEPQSAVETEMQKVFSSLNIEIATVSKLISPHPSKTTEPGDHHYLFVDLVNADDADAAIDALNDNTSPWSETGGKLKVNRARENTGRKITREGSGTGTGRAFGGDKWRE